MTESEKVRMRKNGMHNVFRVRLHVRAFVHHGFEWQVCECSMPLCCRSFKIVLTMLNTT